MKKIGFLVVFFSFIIVPIFSTDSNLNIDLYNQGNNLFQKAIDSKISNSKESRVFYEDSLLKFLQISESVQNGKLYYNIGNIYFQLGDMGRAILFYRKAALLIPGDRNLTENLSAARSLRVDTVSEKESARILETIFFLHYKLSASSRAVLFGLAFALALIGSVFILLKNKFSDFLSPIFITSTIILSIVAVFFFGSVLIDTIKLKSNPGGVVIADAIIARKGDGLSYSPSFEDPLHSGMEFILRDERSGWYYIELSDSTRAWIPDNAAALILLD